jgi:small subunit ribosomal protein S20|uniref:Small ribosomal subunit protein bS20c n=1 Tax=Asterionella formosa TaxID=210441 RepID=A0A023HBA8_9STRA|nr:ribosomal protein S20 [Asterionella formosa]AGH28143.1 ribosomal protein S20 [Asterionella formosa]
MANNKSAEKRIEITKRNRLQNRFYKSSVKTLIKVFLKDLESYKLSQDLKDKEKVQKILSSVYSLIDKGSKKSVFHKNTAARKKSQLSGYLKSAE